MIIPTICLEKANFSVHPFGADDFLRYEDLAKEIYQILSDEETLHFIPEKRLVNINDAKNWLNGAILNFHNGRNAVHFITSNSTGKLVGIIDVIPPAVAREHYRLEDYPYFLEFYLIGDAKGQSIMTNLLPAVVKHLKSNGIKKISAVVNRKNHAAGKVLERSGFILRNSFDSFQDLYALSA